MISSLAFRRVDTSMPCSLSNFNDPNTVSVMAPVPTLFGSPTSNFCSSKFDETESVCALSVVALYLRLPRARKPSA